MVLTVDHELFLQLKLITDHGALYATQRLEDFKEFMKMRGFWPDFRDSSELLPSALVQ